METVLFQCNCDDGYAIEDVVLTEYQSGKSTITLTPKLHQITQSTQLSSSRPIH
jgi:hypothetical protein